LFHSICNSEAWKEVCHGFDIRARPQAAGWARAVLIAGILAGIVYIVYQLVVAEIMGEGLLAPLQRMGSIVLGEDALSATCSVSAAIAGIVAALVLAAIYGIVLAVNATAIPWFGPTNSFGEFLGVTFFFGTALGLLLVERRLFSRGR
jgi:hypothetical protein